jgi:hypothetical protein
MRRRGLFGDVTAYYVKSLVVCVRCTVQSEKINTFVITSTYSDKSNWCQT